MRDRDATETVRVPVVPPCPKCRQSFNVRPDPTAHHLLSRHPCARRARRQAIHAALH